jgi:hypothetical protein
VVTFIGASLVALAVVLFLVHPVVKGLHASLERSADELSETEARKRVALLALRDVEYDYLAGKLDESDYRELKGELTAEALAALEADEAARAREDAGVAGPADLEAEIARVRLELDSEIPCPSCGFNNEEGSRFCSACGTALATQPTG